MRWPWQKEEKEEAIDWSKQYDWYTPRESDTTDWSKMYDWYTPKPTPEPEPPEPTAWDKVKDTAGAVGSAIGKGASWLGRNLHAGIGDYFHALKNIDAKEQLKKSIDTGRSPLG